MASDAERNYFKIRARAGDSYAKNMIRWLKLKPGEFKNPVWWLLIVAGIILALRYYFAK
tara:strand:- start:474 stop:650 length:177 start_codon:yes stop_codon:yes gene_type:complete